MSDAPPKRDSYHHGDLRAALVEAGLRLIEEQAVDDVSLREVARSVGVSATAVYRHFPDKAALLGALAGEGLARLGAAQREASEAAGGGAAGFNATGIAYVRFALANPGLFRLIFSKSRRAGPQDWGERSNDAMRMLQENAVRLVGRDRGEAAARLFALRAWALVHGLAVLILDGQVEPDMAAVEAVIAQHVSSLDGC
jgi:AcrR family transcriptional regulator